MFHLSGKIIYMNLRGPSWMPRKITWQKFSRAALDLSDFQRISDPDKKNHGKTHVASHSRVRRASK